MAQYPPPPGAYPPQNPAYPPAGGGYPQPSGPPGYGPPMVPPGAGYGPPPGQSPYGQQPQPGQSPYGQPPAPYAQPGYGQQPVGAPPFGRPFYIRSEMHGKVLDIEAGNSAPGARVIIWPRKPHQESNQLWYIDQGGCIRSKLNDMMLDASYGPLQTQPCNGSPKQMWMFQGNRIVNRSNPGEVIDISQCSQDDGAEVCCWNYNGGSNQHWAMDYQ